MISTKAMNNDILAYFLYLIEQGSIQDLKKGVSLLRQQ